jgi:cytochrome c biogenesis protein CcdA
MSVAGQRVPGRFDVSKENKAAWDDWVRTYRLMLLVGLVAISGVWVFFGLALAGLSTYHAHVPPQQYWIVLCILASILILIGLMVYAVLWMYRPGATWVAVSPEGLVLEFRGGRRIERRWLTQGFRLRISAVGSVDAISGKTKLNQVAVQSLRFPHFELSEDALSAIVAGAEARNLEVQRFHTALAGDLFWDRIIIRDNPGASHPSS